nr:Ig-like domain-containing protein [uncultured Cohaesibacter sp.]
MADTRTPDAKSEAATSKYESNRVQQSLQKAEAEKASDYDTGDHIALRQDILNPNLHYGLANGDEVLLPEQQSGEASSSNSQTASSPISSDSSSTLPSSATSGATAPASSSGLSAPEENALLEPESPILSINNGTPETSDNSAPEGGSEEAVIPTVQSSGIDSSQASGGSLAPQEDVETDDAANRPVLAQDSDVTTSENVALDGSVTATDLDGDTISYSLDAQPSEGSVTFNADGSYSFDPGTDFDDLAVGESRAVTFNYTADDGNGSTDGGTVTIEVTGTNDAPTAVDLSSASVDENDAGAVIGTLSTTDADISDSHSYSVDDSRFEIVDDGAGNMVLKLKDGVSIDYESESSVTVTVTTDDGNGGTLSESFDISVADLNEAVTAEDASETTGENTTLSSNVSATDLDGDTISYSLDAQPSEGSVTFNADGSYSFDPGTDFDDLAVGESRTVTFNYTANDGNGSTDGGTVTIEVTGTNDAPTAIDLQADSAGVSLNEDAGNNSYLSVMDNGDILGSQSQFTLEITFSVSEQAEHFTPLLSYAATPADNEFLVGSFTGENLSIFIDDQKLETTIDTSTLYDGETHTLAIVRDSDDGSLDIYVDGELEYSIDNYMTGVDLAPNGDIILGQDQDDVGGTFETRQVFTGQIDEVAIFSEARDAAQIAEDTQNGVDSSDPSLNAHWTFSGDDPLADQSGNNHTLTEGHVAGTGWTDSTVEFNAGVNENDAGAVIGTLTTTDADISDSHSYSVDDSRFEVVDDGAGNMVLKLKDGVSLDYESESSVTVTVTTDDGNGGTLSESFDISVADLNEAVTAADASETTSENVALDGSVTATDLDGDTISYSLDAQPSEGSVTFNADGSYSFDPGTDFDDLAVGESRTVTFNYTADDGNGSTDGGTVTIEVTGTNDAPTAVDLSATSVNENEAGAVIGTLSTTDADISDSHSYSVDDSRFEVVDDGAGNMVLKLKDGVSLDYESESSVTVTVTTDDGNGGTLSESFDISVADLNEAVTAEDASETTGENTTLSSNVNATDLDGDVISYSLDAQPSEGSVTFNADGSYSFDPGTDFDDLAVGESRTVTFNYTANDGNGSTDGGTVTIEVTGTNDAPTAVDLSSASVDENASGAVIGTLSTTDADISDSHSYSVDDSRFEIVDDGAGNMVLKLKDGVSIDYESESSVTVTVTTDDGNGGTLSESFDISVADLNEAVTAEDASETTGENTTLSSNVNATDLDGDTISYSLDAQPSEGSVTFNADGSYSFDPGTDFDDLAVGESRTVTFNYTANDGNGSTDGGTVTIEVTGTNDAPTAVDLSSASVDENASGAVIGTLSTTDADISDSHSYSVDDSRFEIVDDGAGNMVLKLKDGVSIDYESESSVTVTVTTDDGNGGTLSESFDISVADLNEAVTAEDASETTGENTSLSSNVSATDLDGDAISYSLDAQPSEGSVTFNADGSYSFDPGTDFDDLAVGESRTVTFNYTADDGNGSTDGGTVTIEVTGTNDAVKAYGGTVTGSENQILNGHAFAIDGDGDAISYSVVTQPSGGTVSMSANGQSSFNPGTDFDDLAVGETRTVSFQYQADDGNGSTSVATVNIIVTGTNDAPTAVYVSNDTIDENDAGAVIGTLTTADVDTSDSHSYSVSDDRFEVVNDGTGNMILKLKDGVSLDHESESSVTITITTDDGNGGTHSEDLVVNVNDVNEGPTLSASGSYNFLYNGSFEIFNGGTHYGGDGTGWIQDAYIDGWTQSDIDIHEAGHMSLGATDGNYHIDLAETSNGTLSREMEGLTDGNSYSLSLDLKSRGATGDGVSGTAEDALGQSVVQVIWNGEVIATIDPAEDGLGWHTYNIELTAGSGDGTNTITFVEVGSENSYGTLIDNFEINDNSGYGVLENEAGAEIALLSVADPDSGESFSYTVSDPRFEVVVQDGDTVLKLVDGVSLDYETASHVSVDVTVTDSGGLSDTQSLDIQVGDIDDTASYNMIHGNHFDNHLNGTGGADNISGYEGNDTISAGAGDDIVYGGTGQDTIDGGLGNDDIYGGADTDNITGGDGNDFINGEDGADVIHGDAGSDSLHGEAGNDWIYGGEGTDTIYGGEDSDVLFGEAGHDSIYGGSGNDYIIGGTGDDYLVGGEGNDIFYYQLGDGNDIVDGGAAGDWTDSLVILASDGTDTTSYGTDWTISLDTGTMTMVDGSDQLLLSDDATGTIDFSDGSKIELENIDNVSW